MRTALITGISGQDGSYLAELLIEKGYDVHGLVLPEELREPEKLVNIQPILNKVSFHAAKLNNYPDIKTIFDQIRPNACYHLAAQSFVGNSAQNETETIDTNINGTQHVLMALKESAPECKFFFAGSSEIFGNASTSPQDETTPINPISLYGITKATGVFLTKHYRENYGIFACNGIMYNHESERRGQQFVTRKISSGVAKIKLGLIDSIQLGNVEARRDWGYAPDYIKAIWLMLEQDQPDDYVIGTGETHSVKEFLETAFGMFDLDWKMHIVIDQTLYRPQYVIELKANSNKACTILNWQAETTFSDLVQKMVMADYERLKKELSI